MQGAEAEAEAEGAEAEAEAEGAEAEGAEAEGAEAEGIASVLDGGKGRVKGGVEAARDGGSGTLHVVARHGRMPLCVYLLEELRVDVNAADDKDATPLTYALHGQIVDIVRYLFDHGADPEKPDELGFSPLRVAAVTFMHT
ncbi:hypothetical protein D1007_53762 [Hordeum vulgare]|nr:hypothetical protein D1007_53762 [Hordeum vulgare]